MLRSKACISDAIGVYMELAAWTSGKAPSMLKGIYRFHSNNAKPQTVAIPTARLGGRRALDWPGDCTRWKHLAHNETKLWQPRTVGQLWFYIRQEWDKFPTSPTTGLLRSQTSLKEDEMLHRGPVSSVSIKFKSLFLYIFKICTALPFIWTAKLFCLCPFRTRK